MSKVGLSAPDIARAIRSAVSIRRQQSHVCVCRCGASLSPSFLNGFIPPCGPSRSTPRSQSRSYAKAHPRLGKRAVTQEDVEQRWKDVSDSVQTLLANANFRLYVAAELRSTPEEVVAFLHAILSTRRSLGANLFIDRARLTEIQKEYLRPTDGATLDVEAGSIGYYLCFQIARDAARKSRATPNLLEHVGRYILENLAALGDVEAVLTICNAALVIEQRRNRDIFGLRNIAPARASLLRLAGDAKADYRILTLAAKLACHENQEEGGIALYQRALKPAQRACVDDALKSEKKSSTMQKTTWYSDGGRLPKLNFPWRELAEILHQQALRHEKQNRHRQSKEALEKLKKVTQYGCDVDDPVSHYQRAEYLFAERLNGKRRYNSAWLYHITKAAAFQDPRAAHRLGVFYLLSEWPYLQDEPEDHVKPTPFDTRPPVTSEATSANGVFARDPASRQDLKPEELVFYSAALFPQTPQQRWKLAIEWLELAAGYGYAPSLVILAEALLVEKLSSKATTPKEALHLRKERYTFNIASDTPAAEVPNDGRDETAARANLEKLYQALSAGFCQKVAFEHLSKMEEKRSSQTANLRKPTGSTTPPPQTLSVDDESFAQMRFPSWVGAWLRYPDVRQYWSSEADMLEKDARTICDRMNWTIRSPEGAIFYQAGHPEMRSVLQGAGLANL